MYKKEIKIVYNGPWIIEMYDNGFKLNKEEADELYDFIICELNTSQYPGDDDND